MHEDEYVDRCYLCDYVANCGSPSNAWFECKREKRVIEDIEVIPEWCPVLHDRIMYEFRIINGL